MPRQCAHATCRNIQKKDCGLTFHAFPSGKRNEERRRKWTVLMRRLESWTPKPWDVVCSAHFRDEDFDLTGQTKRLRDEVIPSQFKLPDHLQKPQKQRQTKAAKRALQPVVEAQVLEIHQHDGDMDLRSEFGGCDKESGCQYSSIPDFHTYSAPDEASLKAKLRKTEDRVIELERQLKNTKAREKRCRSGITAIKEELKEHNLMTAELEEKLEAFKEFPMDLFKKPKGGEGFTSEQKKFALTLHLYGPKAYDYLRSKLHMPSPRTLRTWLSNVDSTTGMNHSMLKHLKVKSEEEPEVYKNVALMIDAMAIRKQMVYDAKERKMVGFVDLGDNAETTDEAKEALVFMVVGLRGHWKAPVAYFLTNTLSAVTQKQLVLQCIDSLHDVGVNVRTLTLDGHASNLGMCRELGCTISAVGCNPSFKHPDTDQEVFVLLDPCHMLKLTRNMFQAFGVLLSDKGRIDWNFILSLQKLQDDAGLRLANRLSFRHTNFMKQKMKVNLAAQLLSNSVANALASMEQAGHPDFQGVSATVEFLKVIDTLFDLMNVRNPHLRGYKAALNTSTIGRAFEYMDFAATYLRSLKTLEGQFVHTTRRHTAITGFIVCAETLKRLVPQLLQEQSYVLTYKLSQDHLELFFNAVRRAGGWNNNPNVPQFKAIFRKLTMHCGIEPSNLGNVQAQDGTRCVSMETDCTTVGNTFDDTADVLSEHDYQNWTLPKNRTLLDNSVTYIAGWIVRKVCGKVRCDICRLSLFADSLPKQYGNSFHLLRLKNNGGLVIPSAGVVAVLHAAEKAIQRCMNIHSVKICTVQQVLVHVKQSVKMDVFDMTVHVIETQYGVDNHFYDLLTLLTCEYYDLRQHHIARTYNARKGGMPVRHDSNKLVLFMGQ